MKNLLKIIGIVVLLLALIIGGWFLYLNFQPQLAMEDVVPAHPLVYVDVKNPIAHWDHIEKSDFYKSIATIDLQAILKHNKVSSTYADQFLKMYEKVKVLIKNPVVGKIVGKEIAFAQYASKDPKAGVVLITRSLVSIQAAANMGLFFKGLSADIEMKKEVIDNQVVMHVVYKQKNVAFKYAHIRDLLIFTDESSPLLLEVIKTASRQLSSIKTDEQFKAIALNFYPKTEGALYVNLKAMLAQAGNEWAKPLSNKGGFEAYGLSFLPGTTNRYKLLLTYDPKNVDPIFNKLIACNPTNSNALSLIPPSAIAYHWGGCYQFGEMASLLKTSATSVLEAQPKRIRKSLQKKLSSQETTDFINLLGSEAGMYMTDVDTQGMFPFPRILFFVKINDVMKAKTLLDASWVSKKGFGLIAKEDYYGHDIHFVALPFGGNMDPGFSFQGNYFLLATSRQLIKKSMDVYKNPAKSLLENKTYKALDFASGARPDAIFYFDVKEVSKRMQGVLEWYDRYMSNQIELVGTYRKEAEGKKRELAQDAMTQKEDLRLAQDKLKEWRSKPTEGLEPEEIANAAATIENFEDQIKQAQAAITDNEAQVKGIDKVVSNNGIQAENYKLIMFNASHILVPLFKGLQSINAQGIKFSSMANTVVAEFMLN